MKRQYMLYLAAQHKRDAVSDNPLLHGTITHIDEGIPSHEVGWAERLPSGCIIVEDTSPLYYQLKHYRVSSQSCGRLMLIPHKE